MELGEIVVSILIAITVYMLLFTGNVKYKIDDTLISIRCTHWYECNILLDKIKSIGIVTNIKFGTRRFGVGSFKLLAGLFYNKQYKLYTLYSYRKSKTFLEIRDSRNKVYLVGLEGADEIIKLHHELMAKCRKTQLNT